MFSYPGVFWVFLSNLRYRPSLYGPVEVRAHDVTGRPCVRVIGCDSTITFDPRSVTSCRHNVSAADSQRESAWNQCAAWSHILMLFINGLAYILCKDNKNDDMVFQIRIKNPLFVPQRGILHRYRNRTVNKI